MPGEQQNFASHSPTQTHFSYSPTNRSHNSNPPTPAPLHPSYSNNHHHHKPSSPPTTGLPPLASAVYQRDNTGSRYYDPTLDRGDGTIGRGDTRPSSRYGLQSREPYGYPDTRPADRHYDQYYTSPTAATFAHESPPLPPPSHPYSGRTELPPHSPTPPKAYHSTSRSAMRSTPATHARVPSRETPSRADPMSLSSIMSGDNDDRPTTSSYPPPASDSRRSSKAAMNPPVKIKEESTATPISHETRTKDAPIDDEHDTIHVNGYVSEAPRLPTPAGVARPPVDEKAVEAELAAIDATDHSDVEGPGFEEERRQYSQRSLKRALEIEQGEGEKRKRRRTAHLTRYQLAFHGHANIARQNYFKTYENEAWQEVQQQEIAEEKERKKDMQRKRRREKTLQNEIQKRDEAMKAAQGAPNEDEKTRLIREAAKAAKKAKATTELLQGGTPSKDLREVTPLAPNLEGGTMSSFQMSEDAREPPRKKGRTGNRPRKSKEQKQAEKDAAAAAHAAMERGEELPTILPRKEARLQELQDIREQRSQTEEMTPVRVIAYDSEIYKKMVTDILKDIAKKDVPKVKRIKDNSYETKASNLRKTAQLASKEAKRWQQRTNKNVKDVQARAKRSMREMLSFWKRNERDERDQRKMAERQELENSKKAEAEREANRQKRKLNFLISQTELYSHFIGKKVKTDDIERSTDDVAVSGQTIRPAAPGAHTIDLPDSVAKVGTKVTNFEDLDFDAEDETALREAAMANAQNAVKEAQDRARAFNEGGQGSESDDGEMNFQNPTSLQNMDVAQPKMLTCQLKEYQLKGLNWLVNLYEQGINGILADEMGLGKTVQSISVMAYLAEVHGIWGPFLVIAPASTLHNWEQEIRKFVPKMKVLPYWGNAKDRKVLRKFWDRKHITYREDAMFHVLVTSYQLVVQDAQYFQKMKWQYMILDEAQAIKSSQSSRWKSLLSFHCRNRLLLTGTPIQNNMQELWALLHFIMPSLFDSHDEFSDWFSKDIESHAQSNTKLNEDQLKRLHMILKPFMLRRIKKHVQKELGDKIEEDVFCDLTYRQRAYYSGLRNKISIMDLIEKAAIGDDQDTATLMNLVMQFRKVCNHPDLFERADTTSPFSFSYFAETASFMREGNSVNMGYSVRNIIEYRLPRLVGRNGGRLDIPGPDNEKAGWRGKYLYHMMNVWDTENILQSSRSDDAFSWLRFADVSAGEVSSLARKDLFERAVQLRRSPRRLGRFNVCYDSQDESKYTPIHALFNIAEQEDRKPLAEITVEGRMHALLNVSRTAFKNTGLDVIEPCARPAVTAPPIELYCSSQGVVAEKRKDFFNQRIRQALYGISVKTEQALLEAKVPPSRYPTTNMLPEPTSRKSRYTHIQVPSMRRFVTDSGKLAKLDQLLRQLKEGGHRVLLYFQMTRMIDLMEEYLTYRNYKYCRLDGSTKLEDRRDTVADFQTRPEIFVFLLSTRAGGLGINLTSADTVIFYDSDWNPTIDSQAMDRAHRLGQTKQVTVYRMITRGTIEERIRKRALQKEEVQRVVISGGAGAQVDFNTRSRENRTKDIAMWLADDEQAAQIEKKEAEIAEAEKTAPAGRKKKGGRKGKDVSLDDMYHEGEGHFDDGSTKPSGAATPIPAAEAPAKGKKKGNSKKAKTLKQRLAIADAEGDMGLGGGM
ncbi:putative DNA helicase ino80 [Coniosporium apollinis]|uniref:Chromatin-remodeling ATPase INO80 n=1 Tax=Coniosporium apollinis TaxID=61459 RepID=A0ABQ9NS69_9PEZI|nr:putative DNA helicase ino80 [Coniosporium apollinis]